MKFTSAHVRRFGQIPVALVAVLVVFAFILAPASSASAPGPATQLVFTTQPAGAIANVSFSNQPVVTIEDANGVTVPGSQTISLTITSSTGTSGAVLTCPAVAAVNGVATFAGCKINLAGSGYTLSASTSVGSPATTITGTSSAFSVVTPHLVFTTQPSNGTGGVSFPTQPVVKIEDGSNNVLNSSATVSLAITSGTGANGAHLTCPAVAALSGVATFSGCSINKASSTAYTLTASATVGTSLSVVSSSFTVAIGPPVQLQFVNQPGSITAGSSFSPDVSLAIEDAGGDVVTSGTGSTYTVYLQTYDGRTTAPLKCTGSETKYTNSGGFTYFGVVAVAGVASFPTCTITTASPSGITYSLIAEATDLASTPVTFGNISSSFTVSPASLSQVVFTRQPAGAGAGTTFTSQPEVALKDTYGNVLTGDSGGTASIAITSGTGATGATLGCSSATISAGVADFTGCSIDLPSTNQYTLTVTAESHSAVSTGFLVTASGPSSVNFNQVPSAPTGGAPFNVSVHVLNSVGQLTGGTVQLTLSGGPSGASLTCPSGTNPAAAPSGIATFTGCSIDKVGTYQLVATLTGVPSTITATSSSFQVSAGPAVSMSFTSEPTSAVGGDVFGTQPVVTLIDAGGNVVTSSGVTVSLALTPGSGATGAALSCSGSGPTQSASTVSGVATFTGCSIDKTGSNYELQATAPQLFAQSDPFNVSIGAPAALVFLSQPSAATVSNPFPTQPTIAVVDDGGNVVVSASNPITLSSSSGDLSCLSTSVIPVNGVATFSGCSIPSSGIRTLSAASTGLASVTGNQFNVTEASPIGVVPYPLTYAQSFGGHQLGRNPTNVVDDVNSGTGALSLTMTDLVVAGLGVPFNLVRTYNSLDTAGGYFGPGWTSIFDAGVNIAADRLSATVRNTDGQQLVFRSNGAGGWVAPPGARATLTCVSTTCSVRYFDGTVMTTQGGRIVSFLSAHGYGLHFLYNGVLVSGVSVQRAVGSLSITVTENSGGEITTVSTPTRVVHYNYGGAGANSNLTGFTDANSNHWTYVYGTALTTVIDPTNITRLAVSYLNGRVSTARSFGRQGRFDDVYTWNGSTGTSTRWAQVTTPTGVVGAPYVDQYRNGVLIFEEQPSGSSTGFSYDGQLNLVEVQNAEGQVQTYVYDPANNLTQVISPSLVGTTTISYTYDDAHHVLSRTDENGNTTTYGYVNGDLTQIVPAGMTVPSVTYTYNSLGERTAAIKANGRAVFSYDAAGNRTGYQFLSPSGSPQNGLGPLSTFNEAGQVTALTSARGHLAGGINPIFTTTYAYDAIGNLLSTTNGSGVTRTSAFNRAGDLIATGLNNPATSTKTTDSFGNTTTTTTVATALTNYVWNETSATLASTRFTATSNTVVSGKAQPSLTVTKSLSAIGPFNTVGAVIPYVFTVTNNGNVTLTAVGVHLSATSPAGSLSSQPCTGPSASCVATTTLVPAQSATFRATYTVTATDLSHGSVTLTGTANALAPASVAVSSPGWTFTVTTGATESSTVATTPAGRLSLSRTVTSVGPYTAAGETISYAYVATNTGNVNLSGVGLSIIRLSPAGSLSTGPTCVTMAVPVHACSGSTTTLVPGQSATFTASYVLQPADISAGSVSDTASATGVTPTSTLIGSVSLPATISTTSSGLLASSSKSYDASGNLLTNVDFNGRLTTSNYDNFDRLASTVTPDQLITTYFYDARGLVVATSDSAGNTTSTSRNFAGQVLARTVNGAVTTYSYDRAGNLISVISPSGAATTYTYNSRSLVTSITSPSGTTAFSYDTVGNVVTKIEGNGRIINFGYDAAGHLIASVAGGSVTTYTYDADGNLLSRTDPAGRTTTYTLSAQGQRLSTVSVQRIGGVQVGPSITVTQTFNSAGQRITMTDASGKHTYTYDALGNLVSSTNGAGQSFTYDYSTPGTMVETYPDGTKVTYAYDDAGNVMSVSSNQLSVAYLRNAKRQVIATALSNGLFITNSYGTDNSVAAQAMTCAGTVESLWSETHNSLGEPIATTTVQGALSTIGAYGYNASGWIAANAKFTSIASTATTPSAPCTSGTLSGLAPSATSANDFYPQQNDGSGTTTSVPTGVAAVPTLGQPSAPSTNVAATDNAIAYDGAGNPTSVAGAPNSINGADELTSTTLSPGTSYTYDASGNVVSSTSGAVTTTYAYNAADQLTRVTRGTTTVTYGYDGDGHLVSRSQNVGGSVTNTTYVLDPMSSGAQVALETSGSTTLHKYFYGVGLVAFTQFSATSPTTPDVFFVQTNPEGDVTAISNASGQLVQSTDYSPYGAPTVTTAPSSPTSVSGTLTTPTAPSQSASYATVTWGAPSDSGSSPIASYVANAVPSGVTCATGSTAEQCGGGKCTATAPATSCVISNLLNRAYVYSVSAINLRGFATAVVRPSVSFGYRSGFYDTITQLQLLANGWEFPVPGRTLVPAPLGPSSTGLSPYAVAGVEPTSLSMTVDSRVANATVVSTAPSVESSLQSLLALGALPNTVSVVPSSGATRDLAVGPFAAGMSEVEIPVFSSLIGDGVSVAPPVDVLAVLSSTPVLAPEVASTGPVSSNMLSAASTVSSGFNTVVANLVRAGYSALELSNVLAGNFSLSQSDTVNELIHLRYDVDGIGQVLATTFSQTPLQVGNALKALGYTPTQIAHALLVAFP